MTRALLPLAAASALLLVTSACSVKTPLPTAWTLPPLQAPAALSAQGPALGLARFTAATDVRTTDLTWRSEDGRLLHSTEDRWAEYPDRMLEDVVRATLLSSGRFSAVSPVPPSKSLDAILAGRLVDFTEWHAGETIEVRVSLEWQVRRPSGEILAQDVTTSVMPLAARSVSGAVKAYQDAAQDLASRLAEAVEKAAGPAR